MNHKCTLWIIHKFRGTDPILNMHGQLTLPSSFFFNAKPLRQFPTLHRPNFLPLVYTNRLNPLEAKMREAIGRKETVPAVTAPATAAAVARPAQSPNN